MKIPVRVAFALCLLSAASRGDAQDFVTGWEGDATRGYAFVAPTAALTLSPSHSVLLRTTASFLYYASQLDGPTDVTAPGVAAALGYRLSTTRVNGAVVAGLEGRRIVRQTFAGSPDRWEHGLSVSGEVFVSASSLTRVSALGSYGQANRYSWMRASVQRQLTNHDFQAHRAVSLGAEMTGQGNRDVTGYQIGGVLEISWLSAHSSLQIRVGHSRTEFQNGDLDYKPYFGIGLYRHL